MSLGKRIKEAREKKKLRQNVLAGILKMDASQYSKIESDKLMPTFLQIIAISTELEVSLDWLAFGKQRIDEENSLEVLEEKFLLAKQNIALQNEIIVLKDKLHEAENSN